MSQEFDRIVDLLREMQRSNNANADGIDRLLVDMTNKLELMRSNGSIDVVSAYVNELTRSLEDKYSVTLVKFQDIEHALRTLYNNQTDNIKGEDLKEVFDVISKNINNFYTEARQEKAILSGIEARLADLISNKTDKNDIVRTISLLRNDFENMNHAYRSTIDNVNTNLKSIISNLISIDPLKSGENTKAQVEIMFHAINDIVNKLQHFEQRSENFSKILTSVVTESDLKITNGILETIMSKIDFIEQNIDSVPDKTTISDIKDTLDDLNSRCATKEEYIEINKKSESLLTETAELRQTLSEIAKDVENAPKAAYVEEFVENLYHKIEDLAQSIQSSYLSNPTLELNDNMKTLKEDLDIIKNIISDLNEALTSKIMSAIESISFEDEEDNLKQIIINEINKIPQKEDIEEILSNNSNIFKTLIERTDSISDQLDLLPDYKDIDTLKDGQNNVLDKLIEISQMNENVSSKLDEFSIIEENVEEIKDNQQDMSNQLIDIADNSEYIKEQIGSKLDLIPEYSQGIDTIVNLQNDIHSKLSQISESNQNINEKLEEIEKLDKIDNIDNNLENIAKEQKNIGEKLSDHDKEFTNIYDKATSIESWLIESNIKENSAKIIAQMQNADTAIDLEFINSRTNQIIESLEQLSKSQDLDNITQNLVNIDERISEIKDQLAKYQVGNNTEISDRLSNLERSISEIISRSEFNDFIEDLKVCVANLSANTGSCSENIEQMLQLRKEIEEKLNSFDFSQVLRVLNGKFDKLQERLAISLSDEIIENIQSEIKDKLNVNEAFNDIKNSVEIVVDDISEKIEQTQNEINKINQNIEDKFSENNVSFGDKIKELKELIIENRDSFEGKNNFNNAELGKITEYLENIKSILSEDANSELSYKLSSIEDMLSLNHSFDESSYAKITEKLNHLEENYSDNRVSDTLSDEISELKLSISDIIEKIDNKVYFEQSNSEFKDFITKKLSELKQSLSSMTVQIVQSQTDDLVVQSVISEEKADLMLSLIEELKNLNVSGSAQFDLLSKKLSDLKDELHKFSENIADKFNFANTELSEQINSLSETVQNIEKSINTTEIVQKLDNLYQEITRDELSPQNTLLLDKFHEDIEEISDKYIDISSSKISDEINSKFNELRTIIENQRPVEISAETSNIDEIQEFKNDVDKFKNSFIEKIKEFSDSLFSYISLQNDELKSLITISNNHDDILDAIRDIKTYFASITSNTGEIDPVAVNNYELENQFNEFSKKVEKLSDDNFTLAQVIYSINQKIDDLSTAGGDDTSEITEEKPVFDFVHAFEILQKDITNLKYHIGAIQLKDNVVSDVSDDADISKVEESLSLLNQTWLDDLKNYISFINNDIASRLDSISSRLDVMVSDSASMELLEEISDIVYGVDEKITNLEDSDRQITAILEELDRAIAEISINSSGLDELAQIKQLISDQKNYIESLAPVEKLDAFKNCIEKLTSEVGNLAAGTDSGNENIQKSVKETKESIMSAVVTLFDQVSFVEESEDIKDFVEERTDEINKNIEQITKQLQQISSGVANDYSYSLQDVETDLAKLRLALNEIKVEQDDQIKPEELSEITAKLHSISSLVDSLTQDEMKELKTELSNIKEQTQFLIATSDKSYNALNNGIVGFEEIINDSLTHKVDRVTRMLEKSADSDNVIKQALIYMGEWIDSASESINKINSNSEQIALHLNKLEQKISNFSNFEEQFSIQQQRIDRLEMNIDKLVSMVENIEDLSSSRKIDKIEKQLMKLGTSIEKLTSYVE